MVQNDFKNSNPDFASDGTERVPLKGSADMGPKDAVENVLPVKAGDAENLLMAKKDTKRNVPMVQPLPHHHHGDHEEYSSLRAYLAETDKFVTVAEIFKQVSDPTRTRIFWLLCHCEECVLNISAMLCMSSPAVSHHLRALKSSGLIVSRREGKEVYYKASDSVRSRMLHEMIESVMEISCPE